MSQMLLSYLSVAFLVKNTLFLAFVTLFNPFVNHLLYNNVGPRII